MFPSWSRSAAGTLAAVIQQTRPVAQMRQAGILGLGIALGRSPVLAFAAGKLLVQRPPLDSEDLCGLCFVPACLLEDAKNSAPLHFVQFPDGLFFPCVPRLIAEERTECVV